MERASLAERFPAWAAPIAVAATFCSACGSGIYDGKGGAQTAKTLDSYGGVVVLGQARLDIGPGALDSPTKVTLRRIPNSSHAGAYGPVFQVEVPSLGIFKQDVSLELLVPFIGQNQGNLTLGTLDPSARPEAQQWIPISNSMLDTSQTVLTGLIRGFDTATALQFGAVVKCPPVVPCPSGQTCSANACQQCPVGTPCP